MIFFCILSLNMKFGLYGFFFCVAPMHLLNQMAVHKSHMESIFLPSDCSQYVSLYLWHGPLFHTLSSFTLFLYSSISLFHFFSFPLFHFFSFSLFLFPSWKCWEVCSPKNGHMQGTLWAQRMGKPGRVGDLRTGKVGPA